MIKNSIKSLGIAASLTMALGYTGIAQAATVTTSGIWQNVDPANTVNLTGVGTNQISWGTPANPANAQSSYVFAGVTSQNVPIPPPSVNFLLGTFTHNNFTIAGEPDPSSIEGADLKLSLSGDINQMFTFSFDHNETPNNQNPGDGTACNVPGGFFEPCPDIVSFLDNGISDESITIDGVEYKLLLSGFVQNGNLVNQFITTEGQANSAEIFGRLERADAIPEPLTILGAGTALGFGTFFKKQISKKQSKEKTKA